MKHPSLKLYEIALTKIDNVGPITAKSLIEHCGSAEQVFKEKKKSLLSIPRLKESAVMAILSKQAIQTAEIESNYCLKNEIDVIFYKEDEFPQRLIEYPDCPILLYFKGKVNLNASKILAIVGTRDMSPYGKDVLEKLFSDLEQEDVLIISGLAHGVDSHAHRLSLIHQKSTVGVLGHGLDIIYPNVNKSLAKQMEQAGGLLTEFGINTKPDRENFPMRNRIVAGMSDAILVVETREEGGSMITADLANQYNKDVFAFPGRIQDPLSKGCNLLIKTHKAQMIESGKDLMYYMKWDSANYKKLNASPRDLFVDISSDENRVFELLQKNNIVHVDSLHQQLNFTPSELAGILLGMELKGIISSVPGKRYQISL